MTVIDDLVTTAQRKFRSGQFDKFIHEMCFPRFKNFAPDTKIVFKFPITVLVGPNGGGKSSILHAAWGMPLKNSTSRFWFSTPVDPIDFDANNQHRYWYSHFIKPLNLVVESRKMRGNKNHGYWEPTRPALKEGMKVMPIKNAENAPFMSKTGDRWTPVDRVSYYFNAKVESSAFDRFFNSTELSSLTAKQDYFVKYSGKLKEVIDKALVKFKYYGVERVAENFLLSPEQLASVNKILQKNYSEARYIKHRFYDKHAHSPSVIFQTPSRSYSECFAGSGELAVVNFVLALDDIAPFGLLLLDEPETSLHPGAQEKLTEHLLRLVNQKFIQVIISTHSPTFVQLLPAEALVVLDETFTGVVPRLLSNKASAFERLGVIDKEKITILTEDNLLKAVVEIAVLRLPKRLRGKVNVIASVLGVSEMFSNQVRAHIQANSNVLMVVDGDQADVEKIYVQEPDDLSPVRKQALLQELKELNISVIGSKLDLGGWMRWCKNRVVLIEQVCPEQILLELLDPTHKLLIDPNAKNTDFKSAVKSAINVGKGDSTADAQYHILRHLLSKVESGSALDGSIQALSDRLKVRLAEFDPT